MSLINISEATQNRFVDTVAGPVYWLMLFIVIKICALAYRYYLTPQGGQIDDLLARVEEVRAELRPLEAKKASLEHDIWVLQNANWAISNEQLRLKEEVESLKAEKARLAERDFSGFKIISIRTVEED